MTQTAKTRQIILDTETTGKEVKRGNRIIEIGALEYVDRKPTGRKFHYYINPEGAPIEEGAFNVHGISAEQLVGKPLFRTIADEFIEFVRGAEILIHNASFDVGFLNDELNRCGKPPIWEFAKTECTLKIAQSLYPNQRNSLDKLCERLEVSNEHRTLHGALLDAELLAEVYFKMTENAAPFVDDEEIAKRPRPPVVRLERSRRGPSPEVPAAALAAHEEMLDSMEKATQSAPVWRKPASAAQPKI